MFNFDENNVELSYAFCRRQSSCEITTMKFRKFRPKLLIVILCGICLQISEEIQPDDQLKTDAPPVVVTQISYYIQTFSIRISRVMIFMFISYLSIRQPPKSLDLLVYGCVRQMRDSILKRNQEEFARISINYNKMWTAIMRKEYNK